MWRTGAYEEVKLYPLIYSEMLLNRFITVRGFTFFWISYLSYQDDDPELV